MSFRWRLNSANWRASLIPKVPEEILKALTPSEDVANNSAHLSIEWLNELASTLPDRYHCRFRCGNVTQAGLRISCHI
jgi:hypothetical protein